jgi:hypothetical protein
MEKDKEEKKDKIEALQSEYMKDRDEPVRLGKGMRTSARPSSISKLTLKAAI